MGGPSSSTDGDFALFSGSSGSVVKDGGIALVTSVSAPGSNTNLPSEAAVRAATPAKKATFQLGIGAALTIATDKCNPYEALDAGVFVSAWARFKTPPAGGKLGVRVPGQGGIAGP